MCATGDTTSIWDLQLWHHSRRRNWRGFFSKSRQSSSRSATTGECEIPENRTKDKEIFPSSARPLIHSSHLCDTPIPPLLLTPPSVFTLLRSLYLFAAALAPFHSKRFSAGRLIFKYSSCPVRLFLSSSPFWYLIIHRTHTYTHFIALNINFRHVCDVFWGEEVVVGGFPVPSPAASLRTAL